MNDFPSVHCLLLPCCVSLMIVSLGCSTENASTPQGICCTIDTMIEEVGVSFDISARCCALNTLFDKCLPKDSDATEKESAVLMEPLTNDAEILICLDDKYGFRERHGNIIFKFPGSLLDDPQPRPFAIFNLTLACADYSRMTYIYIASVYYRNGNYLEILIEVKMDGSAPKVSRFEYVTTT